MLVGKEANIFFWGGGLYWGDLHSGFYGVPLKIVEGKEYLIFPRKIVSPFQCFKDFS